MSLKSKSNQPRWLLTMFLNVFVQGDVGPPGPNGPIGETGHGLPGPKVTFKLFTFFLCILIHMHISQQLIISTRVNVVIQDCLVHLVQKAKAFLAPRSVLLKFTSVVSVICVYILEPVYVSQFSLNHLLSGSSRSAGSAR